MPVNYRIISTKKYMWNGKIYENESEALNTIAIYKKDNFEVQLVKENGKNLIYTRRLATPIQAEK